ncbi:phosphate signaling complex protein PhoU [Paenibacillus sp. YN15]|uniref:phosphate signaling complex protein PhoU n=1 Tax=Paenibacillus sp. YN15 TaxID=1742774 RepID=UPI000DCC7D0E|nr:phosphate signaling complex protein PhoU [Paenibacillus sp. YN15]RAV06588.1 phosphate transport system regulatory protein PhoU [Paenibacillus sp. YN15]
MDTRTNYHQSLKDMQNLLMHMGATVERQIFRAVDSLKNLDAALAQSIIDEDDALDQMMLDVEDRCLRLVALQQPMAGDLRIITMAGKLAVDLERIADHAVDIAKITRRLAGEELLKPIVDLPRMADLCIKMLQESLLAYTEGNVNRAAYMAELDDEVDRIYSTVLNEVMPMMSNDVARNRQLMQLMMAAHYLERVADHATNIGEGVIFMVTGKRKDLNK